METLEAMNAAVKAHIAAENAKKAEAKAKELEQQKKGDKK